MLPSSSLHVYPGTQCNVQTHGYPKEHSTRKHGVYYPIGTGVEHSIYITVKSRIHILPKQRSNRVNTPCYTLEDHQLTGLVFVSVYHTYMSAPKLSMSDVCVSLLRREGKILHLHPLAANSMLIIFLKAYSHFCAYRY